MRQGLQARGPDSGGDQAGHNGLTVVCAGVELACAIFAVEPIGSPCAASPPPAHCTPCRWRVRPKASPRMRHRPVYRRRKLYIFAFPRAGSSRG